jgi:NAD(P)H-nitrite reductase large subunit
MTHHVILGAGPAGVIAAETLRKHAPLDTITIIGDEPEAAYSRMAIPYLLIGKVAEGGTHLRKSPTHFADLKIQVLQDGASSVDVAKKSITLASGKKVGFDTLLLATGSRPMHPPIAGMDSAGVHTCWTLDDSRKIMALAKPGAKVLQMGAGFIGCIIMEALAARGVELSVVEMGDRMVPRMMGPTAGGMIRDWCEKKGVQVFTGTKVEAIAPGKPLKVKLSNGKTVEADLVISATGVRPCIEFLKGSSIACKAGVLTDAHLQTNVPGIYAAGDCAEAMDLLTGTTVVSAIQPNAAEQARIAALNMLDFSKGKSASAQLKQVPQINVLDTLGLISTSFGQWQGVKGGEHVEITDAVSGRHLSLQFSGDVLVGCNSVGWTDHVGVMRGLVDGKVHLGEWKTILQNDPTQISEAYLACAQGQGQWAGAQDARRR